MRDCHIHKKPVESFCPDCVTAWENRKPVEEMSSKEKATELAWWYDEEIGMGILELDMGKVQQRFEELLGRPVWTHELVDKDGLIQEVLANQTGTMLDVVARLPKGKPVVLVEVPCFS